MLPDCRILLAELCEGEIVARSLHIDDLVRAILREAIPQGEETLIVIS